MPIEKRSNPESPKTLDTGLRNLIGRALSSVEFIQDYIQLRFDGPSMSLYTLPSVESPFSRLRSGETGYRDALCEQIGSEVEAAGLAEQEAFVTFLGGTAFKISLCEADYHGPEALQLVLDSGDVWVA